MANTAHHEPLQTPVRADLRSAAKSPCQRALRCFCPSAGAQPCLPFGAVPAPGWACMVPPGPPSRPGGPVDPVSCAQECSAHHPTWQLAHEGTSLTLMCEKVPERQGALLKKWEHLYTPPDCPLPRLRLCSWHQIYPHRQPERAVIYLPCPPVLGRSPWGLSSMSPLEVQMGLLCSGAPGPLCALSISTPPGPLPRESTLGPPCPCWMQCRCLVPMRIAQMLHGHHLPDGYLPQLHEMLPTACLASATAGHSELCATPQLPPEHCPRSH